MKKLVFPLLFLFCLCAYGQNRPVYRGFDGGMMLGAGYLWGNIAPLGYYADGVPVTLGGVARVHLGEHWRLGAEGYFSQIGQMGNGSYIRYGWGGVLADFHWTFGRFSPYAGLTVGGGSNIDLLIFKEAPSEWAPVREAYYHKQGFAAFDPFIGCEFAVSDYFHLAVKCDWLLGAGKELYMPGGPRFYVGFIFCH